MKKKYMKQQPAPAPACGFSTGALFNSEAETWFRKRRERREKIKGCLKDFFQIFGIILAFSGFICLTILVLNLIRLSIVDMVGLRNDSGSSGMATKKWVLDRLASDLRPTHHTSTIYQTTRFEVHATNCPLATPLAPVFRGIPIEPMWINASSNIVVTNSQIIWYTTNYHNGHGIYIGQ